MPIEHQITMEKCCIFMIQTINMNKLLLFSFLFFSQLGNAQLEIDVLSYNVLNYPNGGADRIDTLKKILSYYTPDLMLLQELKSDAGLQSITGALSDISPVNYVSGTWVDQQSNPSSSWKLQQNIIYNTQMFSLAEERVVLTNYRDINYFKLYLNDINLGATGDTIFLHVYVTHLKSSQGATNEQIRYDMAQTMRSDIESLPANSYVLCGGDFNLYTSTELAYQHLIDNTVNNYLEDPINIPGNWHDSGFPNKEILTQSTRLNSLSDGAGGGLDDRFDFVLHSEALGLGNQKLSYVDGSYKALGNNGTCYNQDLLNCTSIGNVPDSIISALYYGSDHLPVVFTLQSDAVLSFTDKEWSDLIIYPNPTNSELNLKSSSNELLQFELTDLSGKLIFTGEFLETKSLKISNLKAGIYLISIFKDNALIKHEKVVRL